MEDKKQILAQNLVKYRKDLGLTQLELAEKLNYSDKAVSKWERGEAYPDVFVLKKIASIYGITVDRLLTENPKSAPLNAKKRDIKRVIIAILSTLIVWLVATIIYVILAIFIPDKTAPIYTIFILAIPISAIILIVFSSIWHKPLLQFFSITLLIWTATLCVYLLLWEQWFIFLIGVPLQALEIFWHIYKQVK